MKNLKKVLFIVAATPLFVYAIVVIMVAIVTCPLLLIAKSIASLFPVGIRGKLMKIVSEIYKFPAYSLCDAAEFIDNMFKGRIPKNEEV